MYTGLESLEGKVGLVALCDVTSQSDVDKLAKSIEKVIKDKSLRFWAVVNNAGVAVGAQIDITPMSAFEKVMAVNYFGVVRTTKAALPFLKLTKHSRVINLSSMAGFCFTGKGYSHYIQLLHTNVYIIHMLICKLLWVRTAAPSTLLRAWPSASDTSWATSTYTSPTSTPAS